jgi:hypothetical protein
LRVIVQQTVRPDGQRGRRGYWDPARPDEIRIGWRSHRSHDHAVDMVNTLIHEVLHSLRPQASESWIRRRAGLWSLDGQIRSEAAIRLLNATFFDEEAYMQ